MYLVSALLIPLSAPPPYELVSRLKAREHDRRPVCCPALHLQKSLDLDTAGVARIDANETPDMDVKGMANGGLLGRR